MKGAQLAAIVIGLMAGANLSPSGGGWSNPYKTPAKRGKSAAAKAKHRIQTSGAKNAN